MEHNDKIKQERIQLAMIIGIYLAIAILLVAIIVMVKNINEIKTDPIPYGIEKKNLLVCSCYDKQGQSVDYNSTGQIPKQTNGWNLELFVPEMDLE